MNRAFALFVAITILFVGCAQKDNTIIVVSREEGSGTREAFTDLVGLQKDGHDTTTDLSEITNSTSVLMMSVADNINSIGYISVGSLSDIVTAVEIDKIKPTHENIKNGTYTIARAFYIVTKDSISAAAEDFISFILSDTGQKLIEEKGFVGMDKSKEYSSRNMSGKIAIAGSTSVAPVVELLAEEYEALNPDVDIEIQQTGSSAGIISTIEGICDIGISSRELKENEIQRGIFSRVIAIDGIAVIVNNQNKVKGLTKEQVRDIFAGKITNWGEL